jgi:hypothetical protein
MGTIDRNLLSDVKAQLRKRAFVPAGMLGQEDPGAAGPPMMASGPGQGAPGAPPSPGAPQDPSQGGDPSQMGPMPGQPVDPTQATGGAAGGMDPNAPGGGPGMQDPNSPTAGMQAAKGKGGGKINDITFLATEVGEMKGRVNLMLELMQGQMAPTKSAARKVAVDEQALWTMLEMLKSD